MYLHRDADLCRYAVQYNTTLEEYTNIASIRPPDQYGVFMYQLYQRQEENSRKHYAAWMAFEKWSLLRKVVQSSTLTSWIRDWVPQLRPKEEFRFSFDNDLDAQVANTKKFSTWVEWARAKLQWGDQLITPKGRFTKMPLNSTNFIDVLASALEDLKDEILEKSNIRITSAIVATPYWIHSALDALVKQAGLKANLEILDIRARDEAAMYIPFKAGKTKSLLLEQSGYDFRLSKRDSSMDLAELSATWIPAHLASEVLESIGPVVMNSTMDSWNEATGRLMEEIAMARNILIYGHGQEPGIIDKENCTIVVPNFGSPDFVLTLSLPGINITRVEAAYIQEVQQAVETMLLKHGEVYEYRKDNPYFDNLDDDPDAAKVAVLEFAKTVPHPQAASGGSWWHSIDALLVLADFPDSTLINRAALGAISSIPSMECANVFDRAYRQYDLAARGAALEASNWIEYWENEERAKKCQGDGRLPECWDEEDYNEGDDLGIEHVEL
jgi:hypothetical protein